MRGIPVYIPLANGAMPPAVSCSTAAAACAPAVRRGLEHRRCDRCGMRTARAHTGACAHGGLRTRGHAHTGACAHARTHVPLRAECLESACIEVHSRLQPDPRSSSAQRSTQAAVDPGSGQLRLGQLSGSGQTRAPLLGRLPDHAAQEPVHAGLPGHGLLTGQRPRSLPSNVTRVCPPSLLMLQGSTLLPF